MKSGNMADCWGYKRKVEDDDVSEKSAGVWRNVQVEENACWCQRLEVEVWSQAVCTLM